MEEIKVYKRHVNSTSLGYYPDEFDQIASIRPQDIDTICKPNVAMYKQEKFVCVEWSLHCFIQRKKNGEWYNDHHYEFHRGFDKDGEYSWASIDQIIYIPSVEPDGTPCLVNVMNNFRKEWHGHGKTSIMDEIMDFICTKSCDKTFEEMLKM